MRLKNEKAKFNLEKMTPIQKMGLADALSDSSATSALDVLKSLTESDWDYLIEGFKSISSEKEELQSLLNRMLKKDETLGAFIITTTVQRVRRQFKYHIGEKRKQDLLELSEMFSATGESPVNGEVYREACFLILDTLSYARVNGSIDSSLITKGLSRWLYKNPETGFDFLKKITVNHQDTFASWASSDLGGLHLVKINRNESYVSEPFEAVILTKKKRNIRNMFEKLSSAGFKPGLSAFAIGAAVLDDDSWEDLKSLKTGEIEPSDLKGVFRMALSHTMTLKGDPSKTVIRLQSLLVKDLNGAADFKLSGDEDPDIDIPLLHESFLNGNLEILAHLSCSFTDKKISVWKKEDLKGISGREVGDFILTGPFADEISGKQPRARIGLLGCAFISGNEAAMERASKMCGETIEDARNELDTMDGALEKVKRKTGVRA